MNPAQLLNLQRTPSFGTTAETHIHDLTGAKKMAERGPAQASMRIPKQQNGSWHRTRSAAFPCALFRTQSALGRPRSLQTYAL